LPKKKKQPRKPPSRCAPSAPHSHVPAGWSPEGLAGMTQQGMSRGISQVEDDDWERLRGELLAARPVCPDCGGEWDLDSAGEEEGFTFDNRHVISISTWCTAYDTAETAGEEPTPHPISQGLAEHEITLG